MFEPSRSDQEHFGPQILSCQIPSFTLVPGEYAVKVWLELKNSEADVVVDAARITVLESDFYGTGKVAWNGALVMKHHWRAENAEVEFASGGSRGLSAGTRSL